MHFDGTSTAIKVKNYTILLLLSCCQNYDRRLEELNKFTASRGIIKKQFAPCEDLLLQLKVELISEEFGTIIFPY